MYRPKVNISRVKQLKELKQEENFKTLIQFIEKNIGKYYKTVAR